MPLSVQLVSPERVLFEGDADMVVCKTTAEGELAFLPGHVPFLGALQIAKVRILLPGGGEQAAAVHRGFVECSNDRVVILSDMAELPEQIDVRRAQHAKERAEQRVASATGDELVEWKDALARADLRLDVAGAGSSTLGH